MSSTHPFLRVLIIFPLFFPPSTCFSILPEEHGRGYHSSAHHLKGRVSSPAWNFAEGGRSHGRSHTAGGDSGIFATRFSRGIASSAKANRYLKLVTVDDHGAKGDERTDDTEVPIDTNSKDHTHVIANTSPYIYIYIYIYHNNALFSGIQESLEGGLFFGERSLRSTQQRHLSSQANHILGALQARIQSQGLVNISDSCSQTCVRAFFGTARASVRRPY